MISSSTGSSSPLVWSGFLVARWSHVHVWQRVRRSASVVETFICPHSLSLSSVDRTLPEACLSGAASGLRRVHFSPDGSLHSREGTFWEKVLSGASRFSFAFEIWCGHAPSFLHHRILKRKCMAAQRPSWQMQNGFCTTASYIMEVCTIKQAESGSGGIHFLC